MPEPGKNQPHAHDHGFTLIELMIVVNIIGILAAIAIPAYQDYTARAKLAEAFSLASPIRQAITEYYAHRGELPPDNAHAGLAPANSVRGSHVKSLRIEQGAVHIGMNPKALGISDAGQATLSLRPAINPRYPSTPVVWLCGYTASPAGLRAVGENLTDIPNRLLPAACKG